MFKKLLSLAVLSSLFISSALADDLLAKISNGAINDNSKGVKVLSLNEQKEVKGGYSVITMINGTQAYAIAKYEQGEINYIANYLRGDSKAQQEWYRSRILL